VTERDIGYLTATQDAQAARLGEFKQDLARIETKIDVLVESMAGISGAKKMLFSMLTLSASFGMILTGALHWFHIWPSQK